MTTARCADPRLAGVPLAVVGRGERGLVVRAASAEARAHGVTAGLRRREAEARLPGLVVLDADLAAEARAFESVVRAVEELTPHVVLHAPGVLTVPTRGPARFFGGDDALASRVRDVIRGSGVADVRVGIADGLFAARLAARAAGPGAVHVVDPGTSPAFLAPWPVTVLAAHVEDGAQLTSLLGRLGITTLGAFAALPAGAVLGRFGPAGTRAHRLAAGLAEPVATPVPLPPDLAERAELEPPATRVDEVAFVAKALADRLLARLAVRGLSCAQVVVEVETEHGEHWVRCWRHDGGLSAPALVTRVRWQLDAWLAGSGGTGALTVLRLVPDRVLPAVGRQLGLWGGDAAAADRADRALARLQGLLGHDAVVRAVPRGGRTPAERFRWVPWGDASEEAGELASAAGVVPAGGPGSVPGPSTGWPGSVPGPSPARVYNPPAPAELLDRAGAPIRVSGRGEPSAPPAVLRSPMLPGGGGPVEAWTGPWSQDVRWWDRGARRRRALWHVVVGEVACLVAVEASHAAVEAIYD